jgi:uncharacterized protein YjiS (DUF1127 family)
MQLRALPAAPGRIAPSPARRIAALAAIAVARLLRWHELARQRRALLTLDDRLLKDIGTTRAEAQREASRPFWSDPAEP